MSLRSALVRVCVALGTAAAAILLCRSAATLAAAAVPSAAATVVNTQGQPVYSGGSTSTFGLSLPGQVNGEGSSSGVFCSNYSTSDPQDIDSYLVPEGTDPSTVTFSNEGPSTGGGMFEGGQYYGFVTVSLTGELPTVPSDFEWEPLISGDFETVNDLLTEGTTPGVWEAGLACVDTQGADQGDVTTLWNFQVTFAASSTDPNGFTWSVPVPPPPTTTTTTAPPNSGSGTGSGGSGSGSSAPTSSASSTDSGSSTTTVPSVSRPSGSFDDDVGGGSTGAASVNPSAAPTPAAASGTAASDTGSSGSGSNAPVKDPGIFHDALAAAGFSSARGIALDILGIGLLLVVIGLVRRRKGDSGEELPT